MAFAKKGSFAPRQTSPVLVRHVFTTNQGIPVSMAVLPHQPNNYQATTDSSGQMNPSGQYILVQRTGIVANENPAPRASSAPPAQNQVFTLIVN